MTTELNKEIEEKRARIKYLETFIDQARTNAREDLRGLRYKYGDIIRRARSEQIVLQDAINEAEGRS